MQAMATTASPPITVDPEVMSGLPVFQGTRVPVQTLFDYLLDGCTLAEFLDNFPSVSHTAAEIVLAYAAHRVTQDVARA
jgi:uncharacterized protein (DUF433 family)